MLSALLTAHSVLRYLILFLLLVAVLNALSGWFQKRMFTAKDNRISLFAMISVHIQLLLGIIIYFMENRQVGFSDMKFTMSVSDLRFYAVEHPLMMLAAIAFITIGRSSSKKMATDVGKFKRISLFYLAGFLIILFMIPWPFLRTFGSWI